MSILTIALNSTVILVAALIVTRVAGLRTFAKMSSIDFTTTIAIGSVIASTILSSKTSISKGIVALVSIVVIQLGTASLTKRSNFLNKLLTNQPLLLMKDGEILHGNLDRSGVSESDLIAKLREANALKFENVKAVVFETTGDISVLHDSDDESLDSRLLLGVEDID